MPAPTPEQSFRSNLSSFRWGSSAPEAPPPPPPPSNPFSRFYNSVSGGYIPLRSSERSNEEEAYFALSRWERLIGFAVCLLGAAVCYFIAFFTLFSVILFRPTKFAMSFSMGSLLVMFGFAVLNGPINHIKHLVSKERLPFSFAYFGSLGLTLYFALGPQWKLAALLCAAVQIVAVVAYVLAYFPGGVQTLRFGGQIALRGAGSLLPV